MQPQTPRRELIAIIGGSRIDQTVRDRTFELGRALARRGLSVICGGRGGVMEAVSHGLHTARVSAPPATAGSDVVSVGLLPGADDREANPYLDVVIPTGWGIARDLLIVRAARAVIAVAGASGTLGEIAFAWQFGKPVGALAETGGWAERMAGRAVDDRRSDTIASLESPDAAASWARAHVDQALGETP